MGPLVEKQKTPPNLSKQESDGRITGTLRTDGQPT